VVTVMLIDAALAGLLLVVVLRARVAWRQPRARIAWLAALVGSIALLRGRPTNHDRPEGGNR